MAHYRLYHLNRFSGHIDRTEMIEAEDDFRAFDIVKARDRDVTVELWQENRKVMRLEGPTHFAAPAALPMFGTAVWG